MLVTNQQLMAAIEKTIL